MPRLFTGLELPDDVALDLQMMQGGIPGARWMDSENFHLTIRFVGDVELGIARELAQGLSEISVKPFEIALKGVGIFGGHKPHSLYVGVDDIAGELKHLHHMHERLCQSIGLSPEGRKFLPHVTLARLKDPDPRALQRWVETHALFRSPTLLIPQFVLFSSRPLKGGGPYAVEEAYQMEPPLSFLPSFS